MHCLINESVKISCEIFFPTHCKNNISNLNKTRCVFFFFAFSFNMFNRSLKLNTSKLEHNLPLQQQFESDDRLAIDWTSYSVTSFTVLKQNWLILLRRFDYLGRLSLKQYLAKRSWRYIKVSLRVQNFKVTISHLCSMIRSNKIFLYTLLVCYQRYQSNQQYKSAQLWSFVAIKTGLDWHIYNDFEGPVYIYI